MTERKKTIRMIDISKKPIVYREAEATGKISLKNETIKAIREGTVRKGNPLSVAEVASALAVKRTPMAIPLCHPIPITSIETDFVFGESHIEATCRVTADYKTGVEMEALSGVTAALLNIWDMVKYIEKDDEGQYPTTEIMDIRITKKRKG
jgi:cyclic pyranopterin phosphate synthase